MKKVGMGFQDMFSPTFICFHHQHHPFSLFHPAVSHKRRKASSTEELEARHKAEIEDSTFRVWLQPDLVKGCVAP